MKILLFTTLYHIEGREDLIRDTSVLHYMMKHLASDHQILVINTYLNKRPQILRYLNPNNFRQYFKDYAFEKDGVKVYLIETQIITGRYFHEPEWKRLARRSKNILATENFSPDLVISHFPSYSYGFIDRLGLRCKKVAVMHYTDLYHARHRNAFINGLNKCYDAVFCRSAGILEQVQSIGIHNLRPEIIYSGTILPESVPKRSFQDFACKQEHIILFVGKLIKRKNANWLLDSLVKNGMESAKLWIIGDGEEENELLRTTERLGLEKRVTFFGQMKRQEVLEYMKQADIFCMPSVQETFGLVYLEAMACGCITIATKGEGIDGIIKDGLNGFLIDSRESMLDCLLRIVNATQKDEKKLEQISFEAIRTGQQFSEENISKRYLEIMKSV